MALTTVAYPAETSHRSTYSAPGRDKPAPKSKIPTTPLALSRLSDLRQVLEAQGFSKEVTQTLLSEKVGSFFNQQGMQSILSFTI